MSQHLEDFQDPSQESHIRRHLDECHGGQGSPEDFTSSIISKHTSAMARQVQEAWIIKSFTGGVILNSKFEYNHGVLPTLTTLEPHYLSKNIIKESSQQKIEKLLYLEDKRSTMIRVRDQEEKEQEKLNKKPQKRIKLDKDEVQSYKSMTRSSNKKRKHQLMPDSILEDSGRSQKIAKSISMSTSDVTPVKNADRISGVVELSSVVDVMISKDSPTYHKNSPTYHKTINIIPKKPQATLRSFLTANNSQKMPANHHSPSPNPANPSQPSASARTRPRKCKSNKLITPQLKGQPPISNYFKMKVTDNPEPDGTPPRPGEQHSKCDS